MSNKFVVIEGSDGAGKSTLCAKVSDALPYRLVKTPTQDYLQRRAFFDESGRNPLSRFFFYCAGVHESSAEIKALLEHENVVADRYLQSLQIYHEVLTGRDLSHVINELDVVNPEVTIILYSYPEIVLKRIKERNSILATDKHLEFDRRFMTAVIERMKDVPIIPGLLKLDTSYLNATEVFEECLPHLR